LEPTVVYPREVLWIVSTFGALTMIGVFVRMNGGFGPQNLRAVGIVLVATLATILGLGSNSLTAAIGLLGAVAGYLFGARDTPGQPTSAKP
jgi:hypothetical protein